MKPNIRIILFVIASSLLIACSNTNSKNGKPLVKVVPDEAQQRVDVFVDDELFTAYLFTDTILDLKKPVLFPIITAGGNTITRGYPLQPMPGERVDHPHHIGMWLNYGDVNKIDFWGHSNSIPQEERYRMGTILHTRLNHLKSGKGSGSFETEMDWLNADKQTLLKEKTKFIFSAGKNFRIIDRFTTLTAQKEKIFLNDTKEGMMAIRVTRSLELPSDSPVVLSDAQGNKTEVAKLDNAGVTGNYLNSEGIEGSDVWGKRATWVSLYGRVNDEEVAVIIFDHTDNVGHPTYWHARGYGLFSVNPLGQVDFTDGKEELNLELEPGESVTFKYRTLIHSGTIDEAVIDEAYSKFINE